jgi:hypothetical protein
VTGLERAVSQESVTVRPATQSLWPEATRPENWSPASSETTVNEI